MQPPFVKALCETANVRGMWSATAVNISLLPFSLPRLHPFNLFSLSCVVLFLNPPTCSSAEERIALLTHRKIEAINKYYPQIGHTIEEVSEAFRRTLSIKNFSSPHHPHTPLPLPSLLSSDDVVLLTRILPLFAHNPMLDTAMSFEGTFQGAQMQNKVCALSYPCKLKGNGT